MKHEILPQEMSILRKLASRVWGNVGESKKCIKGHQKIALNKGGSPKESQALEMAYMVLMSKMPLGVGRKGELMESPLRNLVTAGCERSLVSRLKNLERDEIEEK